MNSIDKDKNGNYLISSRYLCQLLLIDGKTGSPIWRLNGKHSDFTMRGFNRTFAFQHHARIHAQNSTSLLISLFDNGSDGRANPALDTAYTTGLLLLLDTANMVCTLLKEYHSPAKLLSASQGSMQLLPNRHVFMGFGSEPFVAEFAPDGTPVMHAQFGAGPNLAMNYRAYRVGPGEWRGLPDSVPAIWSFANGTGSGTDIYASWNGHTEIRSWRFYGGPAKSDRLPAVGRADKDGFETHFAAGAFSAWTRAEALDGHGKSLGTSVVQKTYVPSHGGARSEL